jgi:hypothetical protein
MGPIIAAGVVALAMVGISAWGAVTLPPGALVPMHHGIGGFNNWQPKAIALIAYPVIGLLVCGVIYASQSSGKPAATIIAPIALLLMAFTQYRAIVAAIRRSGRD